MSHDYTFPKKSPFRRKIFFPAAAIAIKFEILWEIHWDDPSKKQMNNEFQTLVEFLGRCGPEVTGHISSIPRSEEAAKLMRFASGECDARERAEICTMLRLHPVWLRWLADKVKLTREQRAAA